MSKYISSLLLILSVFVIMAVEVLASTPQEQQANKELELMSQDIAALCATPGFRGFLRSEMAKSKNREGIIELDKFLDRVAKRKGASKKEIDVARKVKDAKKRHKEMNLTGLEGFDIYIPVEAHKAKWKGGKDFIVAFAPYGDDQAYKEIVGYQVWDGQRVVLDANKAPDTVVVAIVPEEHDTHIIPEGTDTININKEGTLPEPELRGKEIPYNPVPQTPGNSYVGVRRMYIRDTKEPWTRGKPEIKMFYGTRRGNYCTEYYTDTTPNRLDYVDYERNWYTTWYVGESGISAYPSPCGGGRQVGSYYPCWYFSEKDHDKIVVYIFEQDGGDRRSQLYTLYSGVTCSFVKYSGDDYVDGTSIYKSRIPFEYDLKHDLGNAYVIWHKIH